MGMIYPNTDNGFIHAFDDFCRVHKQFGCEKCSLYEFCEMSEDQLIENKDIVLSTMDAIISG